MTMRRQTGDKLVIALLGPPGSGKGTVSQQWRDAYGFSVLSTGNLCRQHIADRSLIGTQLSFYLDSGKLVPDTVISAMVEEWLSEQKRIGASIILDGYPRTQAQVESLFVMVANTLNDYNFRVVVFELPDEVIVERISNRRVCTNNACQRVYNMVNDRCAQLGQCAKCGSELICRKDDTREVILDRLGTYYTHRQQMLDSYSARGTAIEFFDVQGLTYSQMYDQFGLLLQQ